MSLAINGYAMGGGLECALARDLHASNRSAGRGHLDFCGVVKRVAEPAGSA